MSKNLIPLLELTPEHNIAWNFSLPSTVNDKVVIDVKATNRLMRLGGISDIDVVGYEGERTEYDYGVGGVGIDGTAVITDTHTLTRADLQDSYPKLGDGDVVQQFIGDDPAYQYADVTIRINRAEFDERVGQRLSATEDSYPQAVARVLSSAVAQGIAQSGTEYKLVQHANKILWELLPFAGTVGTTIRSVFIENTPLEPSLIAMNYAKSYLYLIAGGLFSAEMLGKRAYHTIPVEAKRQWALSLGYHLDRVAALNVLSHASKLIRPKE